MYAAPSSVRPGYADRHAFGILDVVTIVVLVLLALVGRALALPCVGDCTGDGVVTVDEIVRGVTMALEGAGAGDCPSFDRDGDGSVTVDELVAAVVAALEGCTTNQAPLIGSLPVYRTLLGESVAAPLSAVDPEGGSLRWEVESLPAGASLDPASGVLRWTPDADDSGAHYARFRVTDDGDPSAGASGVLPIKVSPPDACTTATCDPVTGCTGTMVPVATDCCTTEPTVRPAEPEAYCDGGRIAFLGRNEQGFGRMLNCDRLRIRSFAQGGLVVRFHIEARCVAIDRPATLHTTLRTASGTLVERSETVELDPRDDGFAQELAIVHVISNEVEPEELEDAEAELSVRLVDANGVGVDSAVRVVLTFEPVADLPNPDTEEIVASEAGCVGCHRPMGDDGVRAGIEEAHPWVELSCTDCHGGDGAATTLSAAHVDAAGAPDYLRNLTSDQLDAVDPDYLRFVNPGDFRVTASTCGRSGCHPAHAADTPLSTMATYGGHYTLPRYLAGIQGRDALVGAVDVFDLDFDPDAAPVGAIASMAALRGPAPGVERGTMASVIDEYLPKSCPTCHLNDFGRNNAAGNYRSSGCIACHMVYADDGVSRSDDPAIKRSFPPHPVKHELTTRIPTEQCSHCHFQGGRIGLSYRGIREGGFAPEHTPEHGLTLGRPLHAHDSNYYFVDEDTRNDIDETPPDLHWEAGMVCSDCHFGSDVHGDGNLYSSERHQVGIRCEDCHGTVRAEIAAGVADGRFRNSGGDVMRRLRRREDGEVVLRLLMTDAELIVPQIHRLLQAGRNPAMNDAMGVKPNGFSHTDSLECYTCHTSWRLTCLGCHVTVDDRSTARNQTTSEVTQGAIFAQRDFYSNDFFALGVNEDGKLAPLCNSMTMFLSHVDAGGRTTFRDRVRTSGDGRIGFGWNPFHHHTVTRIPQNCDRCHPVAAGLGVDNRATLNETWGFGNGQFVMTDGDGTAHDLTKLMAGDISAPGELIADFPHAGTGPAPAEVRQRALAVEVFPHPR